MKLYWLIAVVLVSTAVRSQDSTTECLPSPGGGLDCTTKAVDHGPYYNPSHAQPSQPALTDDPYFRLAVKQAQEEREWEATFEKKQQLIDEEWRKKLTTTPGIVKLARSDAEKGVANAQMSLGLWYLFGANVPKNETVAVEWFRKSAAQGNCQSQFELGIAYASGHGIERDWVLAYAWFNTATVVENASCYNKLRAEASLRRETAASLLTPAERAEAQRLSTNWTMGSLMARESGRH